MSGFDAYRASFSNAWLTRSKSGVLEVALHTDGGTLDHHVVPLVIEYLRPIRSLIAITVTSMYGPAIKSVEKLSAPSLFTPF
jgi:hypothetical protein